MKVTLEQYVKIKGLKSYEIAGFRRWARSSKVRRRTVAEWDELRVQRANRTVR